MSNTPPPMPSSLPLPVPQDPASPPHPIVPDTSAGMAQDYSIPLGLSAQERLHLIEENVTDYAIFTLDVQGRVASWNAGAERILGYGEAEIMGQPFALIFTPTDRAQGIHEQELSKATATGRAEDERWHRRKDGSFFWASGILTALRDEAGNLRAFAKILRDFTARKRNEDALREARVRLEATLIAGEIATWTWDIRANRVIADKNLARLFAVSPEDANGGPIEHYLPAIHPDDRAHAAATIEAAIASRSNYEAEYRLLQPDGSIRWVIARGAIETDAAGAPINMPGVVLDITVRKEAQLALAASEARARRFFEANVVGVIHWNLDNGLITDANDVFLNMVGYTREDLAQGRLNWNEMTPPEWQKRNQQGVAEIRTRRSGSPYEKEYFRKDGSRVPIIIGGALFDGSSNEGVSFILDISERVRHLEEIENLNVRLRRSIQETHHRVKNNLQIISALAELQVEEGTDTVPVTAVKRIGQHTRSLAALHDLLTQEAKNNVEADSISTRAALDKLIPLLQSTVGDRPIRYKVDDFRLPVREGASLALLVSELVSNAVKHGRDEIELTLTVNGDIVRLEVCDDGPGFPPDFDWRKAANTGLGLIDSTGRHDLRGNITYENRPEGGARVVVAFPLPKVHSTASSRLSI